MEFDTTILHGGADRDPYTGALSVPIYPASTYHQRDVDRGQDFVYGRGGNPTRKALEETLAALEGGVSAQAFASGMAAITAAMFAVLEQGDHVVVPEHVYGGTYRLLTSFLARYGISYTSVDMTDVRASERAVGSNTRALFLEVPSNPMLKVCDVGAHVRLARQHGLLTLLDNTFLSPYFFRPLSLGVDISIHSATKFLGGHSDLIAGVTVAGREELGRRLRSLQSTLGSMLSPENCWLLLRGIKTLGARMKLQQESAQRVAEWLTEQSWVARVFYPGLPHDPGHALLKSQARGFGAVVSCEVDTSERAKQIMRRVRIWSVAVSLGGVESILSYPVLMSHAAMPKGERDRLGITGRLIRLSVGLENVEDIIADLRDSAEPQALETSA